VCSDKKKASPAPPNMDDLIKQLESLDLTDNQRRFLEDILKNKSEISWDDDAIRSEHDEE